ncbi:MAG: primosomal protein, partial [Mycobacterium sp.]
MAADLVPIRLSLSDGDRYTVWAPRWRDAGDEWEAFLGKDEDLYVFSSVADLVAFVRSDTDNDLVDHPAWKDLTSAHAHKFEPAEDKQFDLVAVEELVAEKPTEESVTGLARTLALVSSIGSVCELAAVSKFFNGNPTLGTVSGGIDHFTGKAGLKRWNAIGEVIGRSWDDVLGAVDGIVTTPEVDAKLSAKAADELSEEPEEEEADEPDVGAEETDEETAEEADDSVEADVEDDEEPHAAADSVILGSDEDFWLQVGIDPIRIMTSSGTFYT